MSSRRYRAKKGSFSQKLTGFLFTTGLVLFVGGYFVTDGLLANVFPTQNPLVGIPAAFAVFVFGWGMLVGAGVLLLATILWLLTAQNKGDQLLELFGLSGLPVKDLRALLNNWRFLAVIVPIVAIGLALMFGLGAKDGTYYELDENGQKKSEGTYDERYLVGVETTSNPDGSLSKSESLQVDTAETAACYWMTKVSGKYQWVIAERGGRYINGGKQRCYQLDSCDGGLKQSGGGCYKWADSRDGDRIPWD